MSTSRTKSGRRFNRRLFLWTVVGACLVALLVHLIHLWQLGRHARAQLALADGLERLGQTEQVTAALHRSLIFAPDDTATQARHALSLARQGRSPVARWRALDVLRRQVQLHPGEENVRRALADLAFQLGQHTEARKQFEALLAVHPEDAELLSWCGRVLMAEGAFEQAASRLHQAVGADSGRVEDHVRLGGLYQYQLHRPERAREAMNTLVTVNPRSARAWLEHSRYLAWLGELSGAQSDLVHARELDPTDPETLRESAVLALRCGRPADAVPFAVQAVVAEPGEPNIYTLLAECQVATGRPQDAIDTLQQGLAELPEEPALTIALVETLIRAGKTDAGRELAQRLRQNNESLPARYLDGFLLEHAEQWSEAVAIYNELTRAILPHELAVSVRLRLARCFAALGYTDQRVTAARAAMVTDPDSMPACRELGEALLADGQPAAAIEPLRTLVRMTGLPTDRILLARALVGQMLHQPPQKRDLTSLHDALAEMASLLPGNHALRLLRTQVYITERNYPQARELLGQVNANTEGVATVWVALRDGYRSEGKDADARATQEDGEFYLRGSAEGLLFALEGSPRQTLVAARRIFANTEAELTRFMAADRRRILRTLARVQAGRGDFSAAERICKDLLSLKPRDLDARLMLFDIQLQARDTHAAQQTLESIARIEGPDGAFWRCREVVWRLASDGLNDRDNVDLIRRLLHEARQIRPGWSGPLALEARLEERLQHFPEAIAKYQQAVSAGEYSPEVVDRAVTLLVAARRYGEADHLCEQAEAHTVTGREFLRRAAEVALRAGSERRAARLAHRVVAGSRSYQDRLWLGRILADLNINTEAEEALREAVALAPDSPDAWVALTAHLARLDRREEGIRLISDLVHAIPTDRRCVAVARCYEALGMWDDAEVYYRQELTPLDTVGRKRLSAFLLRTDQAQKAARVLEELLSPRLNLDEEELADARRQLALALTEDGTERHMQEALALLERNRTTEGDSLTDRRVRALVRATQSAERAGALRELEGLLNGPEPSPGERLRLARLYDAAEMSARAREQYLKLLDQDRDNPAYLMAFIEGLLRRNNRPEARSYLDRLAKVASDSARLRVLRQRLRPEAG
jgi:tetratricopeptide (TPR) repeat protein